VRTEDATLQVEFSLLFSSQLLASGRVSAKPGNAIAC